MKELNFKDFKTAVEAQFKKMTEGTTMLFLTDISRDAIWDMYLASFPEGTNKIYLEKGEYECNTCRQFLRPYGNVVAINSKNQLVSIWDIKVDGYYQDVADGLAKAVKAAAIVDIFTTKEKKMGPGNNQVMLLDGTVKTWNHFQLQTPNFSFNASSYSDDAVKGKARSTHQVFERALKEINIDSINTVLDLIAQDSLYRGSDYKKQLTEFRVVKNKYLKVKESEKANYVWSIFKDKEFISRIRSTAIGTLLVDLSEGKELDHAVGAFESIMAPQNYKRPKALVTKKMILEAQAKIKELGFEDSLARRYANIEDITVNNVLFADRNAKKSMSGDVFDALIEDSVVNVKKLSKVEEISISTFIENVLPEATSIEVLFESKHQGNLMSLIAPENPDAPSMLKWGNNFSWSYAGEVTDSIKQAVKAQGGAVDGVLRFSIAWDNHNDDLDAHALGPNGLRIDFGRTRHIASGGNLDIDITQPNIHRRNGLEVVENITWPTLSKMVDGEYRFHVNNYAKRGSKGDNGFTAEIEFNGEIHSFSYNKALKSKEDVSVAIVTLKNGVFTIKNQLDSQTSSKTIWNKTTNNFHRVSVLMHSPNYWNEKEVGNKHYFFMLDDMKPEEAPRGFFNEFLKEDLMIHKRVFEALGAKMKVSESGVPFAGLGFSSTLRNEVIVRIGGNFERIMKIKL